VTRYLARRVGALVPVWLTISFVAFVVASLAPGDPALMALRQRGPDPPTAQEVAQLRQELHLDDPLLVRYGRWVVAAARGDLGISFKGFLVLPTILDRFGASLQLAVPAFLLALAIALPLGVVSAARRGSPVDHGLRVASLIGASLPSFWLGYLLIIVLSVKLHLLPVAGRGTWRNVVMPALTLALGSGASLGRLARSSLLDTLGEDYVRTAWAKGLGERAVLVRHALRNSLLAVVTVSGLRFARLLAGAAIVETVFTWPGIGRLMVESINDRDYPTIQGIVLFAGTVFVVVNLVTDLAVARLDPRVRLGQAGG
jgi:ABC-type dipeptide/oligopeptide/nickel transport system permease component